MTSHSKLLAAIASVGLLAGTGCLSQPAGGTGSPGTPDAREPGGGTPDAPVGAPTNAKPQFLSTVFPALDAKCTLCHQPGGLSVVAFMAAGDGDSTYSAIEGYNEIVAGEFDKLYAPMLLNVTGPGKIADHAAVDYTPAEIAAIESWLDAELVARAPAPGGGPTPDAAPGGGPLNPGAVSRALIQEWSGCMNLDEWNAENVAQQWADKGSDEGTCLKCHINGQSSFIATRDSERMFTVLTTNKYYMLGYFSVDVTDLANAKMVINSEFLDRVGNGDFPYIEHPQFAINGPALEALTRFYDLTMARKLAGTCAPPVITD